MPFLLPGESDPEHVGHREEPGTPPAPPQRGLDGAAGEDAAVGRPMRELDALALAGEDHRVLADDAAATKHGKADLTAAARPGVAIPGSHGYVLQLRLPALRC